MKVKFVKGRRGDPISPPTKGRKKVGVVERNSHLQPRIGEEWEVEVVKELEKVLILRPLQRVERIRPTREGEGFERVSGGEIIGKVPFSELEPKKKWSFSAFSPPSERVLVEFLYSLEGVEKKVYKSYSIEKAPIPEGAKEEMAREAREYQKREEEAEKKKKEEMKQIEEKAKEALKPFRFSTAEDFCGRAVREGFELRKVWETDSVSRPRLIVVGEEAVVPLRRLNSDILIIEKVLTSRGPVEFPEEIVGAFLNRDYLRILEFLGLLSYREWLNFEETVKRLPRELNEEVTYRQWEESWLLRGKSSKGPGDFEVNPRAEEEAKQSLKEKLKEEIQELSFNSSLMEIHILPEISIETRCERHKIGGWYPESDDGYRREGYGPTIVEDKAVATANIAWKTKIQYKTEVAREFKARIEERIA